LLNFYNHTIDRRTAVVTNDLVYYFTNLDIGKNSGLISGYTGLFWVINLLKKGSYLDLEEEELEVLQRLTYTNIEKSNVKGYDFFSGYLGQYLFLTEYPSYQKKASILVINKLNAAAIKDDSFYRWLDYDAIRSFNLNTESTCYNIGLAHGIPSIIVMLSIAYKYTGSTLALNMLDKAIDWLCSINNKDSLFQYPELLVDNVPHKEISKSRLGWCYGDLSVGYSLYLVSRNLKSKKYRNLSLSIIETTLKRDRANGNLTDHTLCHGTTGIAHMYSRLYNFENNPSYLDASLYWYNETIRDFNDFDINSIKTSTWYEEDYKNRSGLFTGITGIALSLISAIHPIEPNWDRCFLLS
jgi:lantibiotic modifying enzyme